MSLLRSVILTTMIAMFMFVTACQSGGTATRQVVDDSAPTQSQTNTAYTLGTGDKLRINVLRSQITGLFTSWVKWAVQANIPSIPASLF